MLQEHSQVLLKARAIVGCIQDATKYAFKDSQISEQVSRNTLNLVLYSPGGDS